MAEAVIVNAVRTPIWRAGKGEKLNPHGSAIALGHPLGCSGARLMATLINDLRTADKTLGIATLCIGDGQGLATIIERIA